MKPETPLYARFPPIAARLDWLAPLLVRLVFGYFWLETGWAKLHNLDGFAARFVQWGIPFPELSATVSAGMEFIGGLLLMLGLLTRLTMIPMIFNMIVALVVVVLPTTSSSERPVGKECVRPCRSRSSPDPSKNKTLPTITPQP